MLTGCSKFHLKSFDASKEGTGNVVTAGLDNSQSKEDNEKNDKTANPTPETKEGSVPTDIVSPTPSAIKPVAGSELPIYTINEDTGDIEAVTATIQQGVELTPVLIVETVVESMADKSLKIGIESITTKDDIIIVSFYKDQPPLMNVGAGIEGGILDAIAQSLIDNLANYNKVVYRMEGKAYISGHIELGIDEVYFKR